jgi:hypothetical protein
MDVPWSMVLLDSIAIKEWQTTFVTIEIWHHKNQFAAKPAVTSSVQIPN